HGRARRSPPRHARYQSRSAPAPAHNPDGATAGIVLRRAIVLAPGQLFRSSGRAARRYRTPWNAGIPRKPPHRGDWSTNGAGSATQRSAMDDPAREPDRGSHRHRRGTSFGIRQLAADEIDAVWTQPGRSADVFGSAGGGRSRGTDLGLPARAPGVVGGTYGGSAV